MSAQLALALVLLAGGGLLARTLQHLERVPLGYTSDHLSFLTVAMPTDRYGTPQRLSVLAADLIPAIAGVPGVIAVTPVLMQPFSGTKPWAWGFVPEGASPAEIDAHHLVAIEVGGPDYFRAFGARLLRGRGFTEADRANAPYVAVVSEGIATRFWPGQDPIGKRIRVPTTDDKWLPGVGQWRTVVGVTEDPRYRMLRQPTPTIYLPWHQMPYWEGVFAIRTRQDLPAPALISLQRAVREVDRQVIVWRVERMDDFLAEPLAQPRLGTLLLSAFGLAALVLAAIGLYGVVSAAVRARHHELAIRMALGATAGRLRRDVVWQTAGLFALGALLGAGGVWAGSRALESLLYEVSPTDPIALISATLLLFAVALGAAYIPANRATQVNPAESLRSD